ncbi:MAG: hypothetical protein H7832_03850 [Magnetococcus sp. DMHC-6]
MLEWILLNFNHPWISWLLTGLVLAWGIGQWIRFRKHYILPVQQSLSEATHFLQSRSDFTDFYKNFQEIDTNLSRHPLLSPAWISFSRTLLASEKDETIRSYRRPEGYFHFDRLIHQQMDWHFFQSVPSLLIGAGTAMSFLGVLVALYLTIQHLNIANISVYHQILQSLLQEATFKFLPAIFAILAGSLFAWREKFYSYAVKNQIRLFCLLLQNRIGFVDKKKFKQFQASTTKTIETIQSDQQEAQLARMVDHLTEQAIHKINHETVKQIATAITPMLDRMQNEEKQRAQIRIHIDKAVETLIDSVHQYEEKTNHRPNCWNH